MGLEGAFALSLLTIGALLLAALAADALGRLTGLPRITLLVAFGVLIGPAGLDWLPFEVEDWREPVAALALSMVAFLIGGELSRERIAEAGRDILALSLGVAAATMILVGLGLWAIGAPPIVALALAGVALATDPAAVKAVIAQSRARGRFATTLKGVVAIDDAWGIIAFGLILAAIAAIAGPEILADGGGPGAALRDLGAAALLGAALGLPAAWLTGRLLPGEPTREEAIGVVLLCTGAALWLDVSFLMANLVMGLVVANTARHHTRAFREIERIEPVILIIFFVLAGAMLDPAAIIAAGPLGLAFIALRCAGRVIGAVLGGLAVGMAPDRSVWAGLALTPQAGVALGMALVAAAALPAHGEQIMTVAIASTIVFELFGPVLTRIALARAGDRG